MKYLPLSTINLGRTFRVIEHSMEPQAREKFLITQQAMEQIASMEGHLTLDVDEHGLFHLAYTEPAIPAEEEGGR